MLIARFGLAAGVAALLVSGPAFAGDNTTVLLGGVGSLAKPANVSATTLQGKAASDAETLPVCCWRRWAYAAPVYYPAPVVVAAAPVCCAPAAWPTPMAAPATAPPPAAAAYYRALPPASELAVAPRPTITLGYQGRLLSGSIAIRPRVFAPVPSPSPSSGYYTPETMPQPRSGDDYRYDGGPNRPVPMPSPDPISPTDPVPMTIPALHRVSLDRTPKKVTYPAYGGDAQPKRPTPANIVVDPLFVKRTAN